MSNIVIFLLLLQLNVCMFHTKNKVITFWYHECQTKNVFISGRRKVEDNNNNTVFRTTLMFEFHIPLFGGKKELHSRSRHIQMIILTLFYLRQERAT